MASLTLLQPSDNSGAKPLAYTAIGDSWRGDKLSNTEAERIITELRAWAGQFHHEEAQMLNAALEDIEKLFTRVWTTIDESLLRLKLMQSCPDLADKYLEDARMMMNRWQDRGGMIGNANLVK